MRSATGRKQKTVWRAKAEQKASNEAALARLQWLLGVSAYPSLYLRDRHGYAQNGRLWKRVSIANVGRRS
jgi:hypothetical protein